MTARKRASGFHYDKALVISYSLGLIDFGAGNSSHAIKPPYGLKNGMVIDIHVSVTETFNQVTTPAYVRIGTAADADKYAQLNLGAAAITDAYNSADVNPFLISGDDVASRIIDMDRDGTSGAAISQLEVACIAPTGGTPAGIGYLTAVVGWW